MGLSTGHPSGMAGLGNTAKADITSLSGVSENMVDIYNYNKITLHLNLG